MKARLSFTITGFLIAIVVIAMVVSVFASFTVQMGQSMGSNYSNESVFSQYEKETNISGMKSTYLEPIREDTQEEGIGNVDSLFDIFGAFLQSGYTAIQTTASSFTLFEGLMNQASADLGFFTPIKPFIIAIVLVGLFVGVLITVLVKMRI